MIDNMKLRVLSHIALAACLLAMLVMTPVSADNLLRTDFQKERFEKTVDYFDYARALALLHGLPQIPNFWHAYVYMTYVNKMGVKMLYAGLSNISLADQVFITIPAQTFFLQYKTANNSRDALVASSFLMLMGFNDTDHSIHTDSPDRNDTLWASFSMGFNLDAWFPNAEFPSLHSKTETFPLTSSDDDLTWSWGMRYTNLTATWWTIFISPDNATSATRPWGRATYDELTFNYTLTINPDTHTANITENHIIGRMRDLWVFQGWFLIPFYKHYNSTGCYQYGAKLSDETVYEYLRKHRVKMSIVDFQTSVMLDRDTYSTSASGQNVTGNNALVSDSSVSTYADDGEKLLNASFGVKETYNLFNCTEDSDEGTPHAYDAVTRTSQIDGYAKNRDLFRFHRNFMRYLPLILVHMYPQLYQRAKETITNMTRANYLFLISYPNYSGYRIEHDPLYTIYFAPTTAAGPNYGALIVLIVIGGAAAATVAVIVSRIKKPKHPPQTQSPKGTQTPAPPQN